MTETSAARDHACLSDALGPKRTTLDIFLGAGETVATPVNADSHSTAERVKRQLSQLVRARFDITCADELATELESLHDDISPRAWGLLTGMAVSYARPFTASKHFGTIPKRWRSFPGEPELADLHERLIVTRHSLLAHNDATFHRATVVFGQGVFGEVPSVTEGRSPVDIEGIENVRRLFAFQLERLDPGCQELLARLVALGAVARGETLEF